MCRKAEIFNRGKKAQLFSVDLIKMPEPRPASLTTKVGQTFCSPGFHYFVVRWLVKASPGSRIELAISTTTEADAVMGGAAAMGEPQGRHGAERIGHMLIYKYRKIE